MATVKFYEAGNMLNFKWKYGFPTDEAHLRSNYIYNNTSFGTGDTVVYRGTFSYNTIDDANGHTEILGLKSGTLTGYEWYDDQILRVQMSGLNYDAVSAFIYMQMSQNDPAYRLELMEELLTGNDTVTGSAFNDTLAGFAGDDTISGGKRHDQLFGNDGNDTLNGNFGQDTLIGGAGADTLTGEGGIDTFRYDVLSDAGDTITDFGAVGDDNFAFSAKGFKGGLVAGNPLGASQFQSSTSDMANTADVRFIYDTDDHKLYFDIDGNGANAAVLIATLQVGAIVNINDFIII